MRRERGEGTTCKEEEDKSSTKAQRRDESMICAKMVARAERRPVSKLETFTNNRDGSDWNTKNACKTCSLLANNRHAEEGHGGR